MSLAIDIGPVIKRHIAADQDGNSRGRDQHFVNVLTNLVYPRLCRCRIHVPMPQPTMPAPVNTLTAMIASIMDLLLVSGRRLRCLVVVHSEYSHDDPYPST